MKKQIALIVIVVLLLSCIACKTTDSETLKIAALKGPTGMGLAYLMQEGQYSVELLDAPDVVTGKFINGEIDVAAVPINLAAVLFNKTQGEAIMIGINTLGVLSILENGNTIQSFKDLTGKKIYATGQGSTPQYILEYLLAKNGITESVEVEYIAEHAALAAMAAAGEANIVMLPEPNVSAVLNKNSDLHIALNLTEEWGKVSDTQLLQGCYIVRKAVLEENRSAVERFLTDAARSAEDVVKNENAAALIAELGIVPSEEIARKAIPNCNIVCITGDAMQTSAEAMFKVLFDANPKSIGGKIPGNDIYALFKS